MMYVRNMLLFCIKKIGENHKELEKGLLSSFLMQHLENGRICKKGLDELSKMVYYYKAQKLAEVVERQTRCLQAAVGAIP